MNDLLSRLLKAVAPTHHHRLIEVARFATEHLSSIRRSSGESYDCHGLEVAVTLLELTQDASLLTVAILHDLLVHPRGAELLKGAGLTAREEGLVREMHLLRRLHIDEDTGQLENVLSAFTEDTRLIFLRMAHRLNDVRHLDRFFRVRQRRIARETIHIYSAIAGRLGLHAWRHEMEDTCFLLLQPEYAKNVRDQYDVSYMVDIACLTQTKRYLAELLKEKKIASTIDYRRKSLYSTYRKMVLKKLPFQDLTDRIALRVVVKSLEDCYRALGVVHAGMHPIPGKLKDYIGAPKENGYRSIHTVVYPLPGVSEQPIEIQIRTAAMHDECEFGIAAHAEYKKMSYALEGGQIKVNLFRNLEILRQEARSPKQFEQAMRHYFRDDQMLIFDSENNLYHLKKPATGLDFVCTVYPTRALKLRALYINGRHRSFDTALKDGDTVEAKFGQSLQNAKGWLNACHHQTSRQLLGKSKRAVRPDNAGLRAGETPRYNGPVL